MDAARIEAYLRDTVKKSRHDETPLSSFYLELDDEQEPGMSSDTTTATWCMMYAQMLSCCRPEPVAAPSSTTRNRQLRQEPWQTANESLSVTRR
jgi:predicted GNAT superfamily acetyltransferase